jgi:uncharacterized protein YuzE
MVIAPNSTCGGRRTRVGRRRRLAAALIVTAHGFRKEHPRIGPYAFDDVDYDAESDVLYLSIGIPQPAADSGETPEGHIIRYDEHDRVIGVTIVGARDLLDRNGVVSLTLPRRSVIADRTELAAALAA